MSRITDRHDVPQIVFMLTFYAVLAVGCGMMLRVGWRLMEMIVG